MKAGVNLACKPGFTLVFTNYDMEELEGDLYGTLLANDKAWLFTKGEEKKL